MVYKDLKELWKITISLFGQENVETCTQWGWKFENETLFLNFQGSVSKLDWKQNFDFLQVPYKSMPKRFRVHRGFLTKWKSIQDDVIKVVRDHKPKRIVITGFSQGGALATLCHEDLVYRWYDPETWAFGSPRVFSWGVPKNRFKRLTRVTLHWDMIPGIPFWFLGYKHIGKNVHYGRKPRLKIWPWDHMKFFEYWS
jgi:hypothetical protein